MKCDAARQISGIELPHTSAQNQDFFNLGVNKYNLQILDYPSCGKKFEDPEKPEPTNENDVDVDVETESLNTIHPHVQFSSSTVDNAFFIGIFPLYYGFLRERSLTNQPSNFPYCFIFLNTEYLKQAYEATTTNSENRTLCINSLATLEAEKKAKQRSIEFPLKTDGSRKNKEIDVGRIIRGNDALQYEYPWQVSIQEDNAHVCGGAIISDQFIL